METFKKKIQVGDTELSFEIDIHDLKELPKISSSFHGNLKEIFQKLNISEENLPAVFSFKNLEKITDFHVFLDLQTMEYQIKNKINEDFHLDKNTLTHGFELKTLEFSLEGQGKSFELFLTQSLHLR